MFLLHMYFPKKDTNKGYYIGAMLNVSCTLFSPLLRTKEKHKDIYIFEHGPINKLIDLHKQYMTYIFSDF